MTASYTDAELESLMADRESDLVERKESFKGDAPTGVREAVCAFANDLPDRRRRGVVFIGAHDDGRPSGIPITDELLRTLSDIKTDGNIVDALPVPSASIGDLDLRRFDEEHLPLAIDPATLAANDRSIEERLAATKMIAAVDAPTPTIGGILVLGRRPQDYLPGAYAQFLRVAGTDLSDPIADESAR